MKLSLRELLLLEYINRLNGPYFGIDGRELYTINKESFRGSMDSGLKKLKPEVFVDNEYLWEDRGFDIIFKREDLDKKVFYLATDKVS